MSKGLKTLLIVGVVIVVILFAIGGSYNKMVKLDQSVKQSESDIDTQLQRRSDLIPNLIATVKGYASQEKSIFTELADARAKLAGAQNITQKAEADNQLSGSLSRLLVVVENYPDLKSNQNFRDLSIQLEGTENRIAVARMDYNDAVQSLNKSIRTFPSSIIAGMSGIEKRDYFEITQVESENPTVNFSK